MNEVKQYNINGIVYEVEYHYKDDTQRNKHITNTEVRFTRVSLEMARRFFEMELLDHFKMLVEILEYEKITGGQMKKYYRPPQGKYSTSNLQMAKELGYTTFFWSLAYVDWYEDDQPTHEEAFDKLLTRVHPGAIILLHSTSSTNAEILDELLTRLEDMGYVFKSLDSLTK